MTTLRIQKEIKVHRTRLWPDRNTDCSGCAYGISKSNLRVGVFGSKHLQLFEKFHANIIVLSFSVLNQYAIELHPRRPREFPRLIIAVDYEAMQLGSDEMPKLCVLPQCIPFTQSGGGGSVCELGKCYPFGARVCRT